jgi:prepilin-type processing-associated H-X9-DG protein
MGLIRKLDELVAGEGGYFYDMSNPAMVAGCHDNLTRIWQAMQQYAKAHDGKVPDACFYPDPDNTTWQKPSFDKLLGFAGQPTMICPGSGDELKAYGLTYLWNERWSGKPLAQIPNPSKEWLVMDLIGLNPYVAGRIGHNGGAQVLYADGHIGLQVNPQGSLEDWLPWAENVAAGR